jgi:hypothetical protein
MLMRRHSGRLQVDMYRQTSVVITSIEKAPTYPGRAVDVGGEERGGEQRTDEAVGG